MKKFSITDKLIIASLLLSIVTIMIVASYSFYNAKDAILERAFNHLNSVRVIKTNLIENYFSNCSKKIQLAKSSSEIQEIVKQINKLNGSSNYRIIKENLPNLNSPFIKELSKEYYNKIFIIGNNKLIYQIKKGNKPDKKSNSYYKSLWENSISNESTLIQDYTTHDTICLSFISLSSKIIDSSDNILGVIVFEVLSNAIDSTMLNKNPSSGLGTSGESYLVGPDYLMRSSSRFQTNSVLNTVVKTEAVDSAIMNKPGTKVIKDYRDVSVLSSYSKISIPNLNWIIITEIDYNEVTIPIYKIRNEIIFISIFIFFIVLVVVIIFSKKITSPIHKLNQAAHEVGAGNLNIEIDNNSDDEIGELTDTFNQMIKKLKTQTIELETERIKSLRSLINGQESERQRLSRELHDGLGQLLIGLKLKYESYLNKSKSPNIDFLDLGTLFDKTIEETRRISNNLMPAVLSEFGLTSAIRNICNDISETTNINIQLRTKGVTKKLSFEITIYLFRIIQEALTNILKHSEAKNASIHLLFADNSILIDIEDDGKGFNKSKTKQRNSNGLNNIKDRVSLLSGKLVITSEILKGTKMSIEIPIKKEKNGKNKNCTS